MDGCDLADLSRARLRWLQARLCLLWLLAAGIAALGSTLMATLTMPAFGIGLMLLGLAVVTALRWAVAQWLLIAFAVCGGLFALGVGYTTYILINFHGPTPSFSEWFVQLRIFSWLVLGEAAIWTCVIAAGRLYGPRRVRWRALVNALRAPI